MGVEVEQGDDGEGRLPLEAQAAHHCHHLVREPLDEAELVQEAGHSDQRRKPREGVPGLHASMPLSDWRASYLNLY